MSSENKTVEFLTPIEEDRVSRRMVAWLNTFPDIPPDLNMDMIDYEYIPAGKTSMTLSAIQSTYIVERDIVGNYIAEYQFKVIYRVRPGNSPDGRLKADELLNRLGNWADGQRPDIGEGLTVEALEQTTLSSLFATMEDGWEDHQIFMRMTYKVRPQRK